ncbi:MAG: enoyl-CoA hydratase/isomerase family protein [Actinomycetota bacterium]
MEGVETIRVEVDGPIGHLTLARPDKLNPLSAQCLDELARAAGWFDDRPEVRAVIVRGEGRAFSAGADLGAFTGSVEGWSPRDGAELGRRMVVAVEAMRAVTISAVHGHCIGGGVLLAAACDLRVADAEARFSIPEVDLGIPLAWSGIPRLVREIGPAATKDLVLTCRPFGAEEARAAGLITRVVAVGDLEREAEQLARAMAGRSEYAVTAVLEAVDACAEELVGTGRSAADADQLVHALHDPASAEARERYLRERGR